MAVLSNLAMVKDTWTRPTTLLQATFTFVTKATDWDKNVFENLFYRKKGVTARLKGV